MKKYDVLILCQFFYPEYISSAVLPFQTAEDLVDKGLKVKVVCGYPKEYSSEDKVQKKETINGIDVFRVNYLQLSRKSKLGRLINYFSFFMAICLNWKLLIDNKCTMVYSNPPILPLIPIINKKLFKIKYMFISYDIYPDVALITKQINEDSLIHKIMRKINKLMDKNVDQVVALSEDMKNYFIKTRVDLPKEKITVIPNWYDDRNLNLIEEITDEEVCDIRKENQLIVLYSGNMGICQDIDIIIDAANLLQQYDDIIFILTGHGQKQKRIEEKAKEMRLNNVKLYGFLSGKQYTDMLKAADIHLVSLEKGIEGICVPSKTYSYMAIGKPLVAIMDKETDIATDIIDNQLGHVVNPGDYEQLATSILDIYNKKNDIEKIGKMVREVYQLKYTRDKSSTKYYNLIKKILD